MKTFDNDLNPSQNFSVLIITILVIVVIMAFSGC
jgi:hypothetical protein